MSRPINRNRDCTNCIPETCKVDKENPCLVYPALNLYRKDVSMKEIIKLTIEEK